jgi:hypothetical protein
MSATPTLDGSNPNTVLAARADERLAHAYEQIASADEQLARVTEKLARLEQDAARYPSAVIPGRTRGRPVLRGLVGLVLAACIGAAAYAAQSPSGEAIRPIIARWAPFLLSTSLWLEKPGNAAEPKPPAIQLASADATAPQPAQSSPGPAQAAAPTPAPMPPELTQLLQNMARDIATVEQGIEQLKASQQQMAADSATAVAQLKAGQEQMTRLAARPAVADQRAKTPAPEAPPIAVVARKPPPQARPRPQPIQLQPDDQ